MTSVLPRVGCFRLKNDWMESVPEDSFSDVQALIYMGFTRSEPITQNRSLGRAPGGESPQSARTSIHFTGFFGNFCLH